MPPIARFEQPHRRLPHLRWRVVPQLGRNDLMHRQVKTRIDRAIAEVDLAATLSQPLFELGMLVADDERAHVGISEVLDTCAKRSEHTRISDERLPIDHSGSS